MAVTKISRISRWTLYALTAVTLALLALFFFGGYVAPENQYMELVGIDEPNFTNGLLYWIYVLLAVTVFSVFAFSVFGFINNLRHNRKKAMNSLVMLAIFAILLVVAYSIGDGTPLNILGYEGPDNVPTRLKMTDMWIYSVYILMGLVILSMLFSPLIKRIGKRK
jgi:NADH:ubiquinone oxidoreductase subunit 5 (subunit L)/multisubunit Na+/H+ antiporter MnhA subunit